MSQITMRPPHAGMKVSMLGSSYAYARMPLGSTSRTGYFMNVDGIDYNENSDGTFTSDDGVTINAAGNIIKSANGSDIGKSVVGWIDSLFQMGKNKTQTDLNRSIPAQDKEVPKDNTALYVVGGAAALIVLVMVVKK
jgi:hypothetical protein